MSDESDSVLREKILELVGKLPASFVYNLLHEIEGMDDEPLDRVQLVRQYVIEYLNRQRSNRARRLFTAIFEAFLIDDDALYHVGAFIPGMVQRLDIGALWEALSREAFPLLAVEAQEALDQLARDDLLERVLRAPVAVALQGRMRAAALKHLNALLANRRQLDEFLALLSKNRARRTKVLSAFLDKPPPFEVGHIQLYRTILAHAEGAGRELADCVEAVPADCSSEWECERVAENLIADTADLRDRVKGGDALAPLLPLTVLHGTRNYPVVAHYIRQSGFDPGKDDAVAAALTAHYLGTVRAIVATLLGVLRLEGRVPGSPIRPSAKDKARLEGLLQRLHGLLEACITAGLMEDRRTEPTFRNAWEGLAKLMSVRVAAMAMERASVAASARRHPAIDHKDVVWLMDFIWTWQDLARRFAMEAFDMARWRESLLQELQANTERAIKFEDDDPLDERMDHLLRINAISRIFGQRVSAWLPTTSHNTVQLLTHRLMKGGPKRTDEQEIIDDVVAEARTEVARNRYWKSHELVALIELSEGAAR